MDLVIVEGGQVSGVLTYDHIIDISSIGDFIDDKECFTLRVKYSEHNWKLLRDAEVFFDNEVPEAPVTIDSISVIGISIVVAGHAEHEDLMEAQLNLNQNNYEKVEN